MVRSGRICQPIPHIRTLLVRDHRNRRNSLKTWLFPGFAEPPSTRPRPGSRLTSATEFRTRCGGDRFLAVDFGMLRNGTASRWPPVAPGNGGRSLCRRHRARKSRISGELIRLPLNVRISTYRLRHPQGLVADPVIQSHAMRRCPNYIGRAMPGIRASTTIQWRRSLLNRNSTDHGYPGSRALESMKGWQWR